MPINNRHAFGGATHSWGGRDVTSAPEWCLTVADFPVVKGDAWDDYRVPHTHTPEKRGPPPSNYLQWARMAKTCMRHTAVGMDRNGTTSWPDATPSCVLCTGLTSIATHSRSFAIRGNISFGARAKSSGRGCRQSSKALVRIQSVRRSSTRLANHCRSR